MNTLLTAPPVALDIAGLTLKAKMDRARDRGEPFDPALWIDVGVRSFAKRTGSTEWEALQVDISTEASCVALLMKHHPEQAPEIVEAIERFQSSRYHWLVHVLLLGCAAPIVMKFVPITQDYTLSDLVNNPRIWRAMESISRCIEWTHRCKCAVDEYDLAPDSWRRLGYWTRRIHTLFNSRPIAVNTKRTRKGVENIQSLSHAERWAATLCLLEERDGSEAAETAFTCDLWRFGALGLPVKTHFGIKMLHAHTEVRDRVFLRRNRERQLV